MKKEYAPEVAKFDFASLEGDELKRALS